MSGDEQVSKRLKESGCKPDTPVVNAAGSTPALLTRQLPSAPPLPKQCSCGLVFTDGSPLYCGGCRTFTHTVYWMRST